MVTSNWSQSLENSGVHLRNLDKKDASHPSLLLQLLILNLVLSQAVDKAYLKRATRTNVIFGSLFIRGACILSLKSPLFRVLSAT